MLLTFIFEMFIYRKNEKLIKSFFHLLMTFFLFKNTSIPTNNTPIVAVIDENPGNMFDGLVVGLIVTGSVMLNVPEMDVILKLE